MTISPRRSSRSSSRRSPRASANADCMDAMRASRRPLRGLLSTRKILCGTKKSPRPEEPAKPASRRTHRFYPAAICANQLGRLKRLPTAHTLPNWLRFADFNFCPSPTGLARSNADYVQMARPRVPVKPRPRRGTHASIRNGPRGVVCRGSAPVSVMSMHSPSCTPARPSLVMTLGCTTIIMPEAKLMSGIASF